MKNSCEGCSNLRPKYYGFIRDKKFDKCTCRTKRDILTLLWPSFSERTKQNLELLGGSPFKKDEEFVCIETENFCVDTEVGSCGPTRQYYTPTTKKENFLIHAKAILLNDFIATLVIPPAIGSLFLLILFMLV